MKTGIVLGAGGVIGLAYHSGVLRALEEVAGLHSEDAELIVGTSAGAVVGAYLRSGWSTDDMWHLALGTHPSLDAVAVDGPPDRSRQVMAPAFRSPLGLARRSLGAAFVLGRAAARMPGPPLPKALGRVFPGGLFAMPEGRRRFAEELRDAWPERDLWLCTVDIRSGRRVVLGREGAPAATLRAATEASCAIPGVYKPVMIGDRPLVDGGVWSTTNLDLAAAAGCDLVVCSAPMAFDPARPPGVVDRIVRGLPTRMLARESGAVRKSGARLLVLRPTGDEVRTHGFRMMRRDTTERVARAAYDATAAALSTAPARRALDAA